MRSFKFTADKHKLITHRGVTRSSDVPPTSSPAKADVLTRLVDKHSILHQLELVFPSSPSSPPPPLLFPSGHRYYHVTTSLSAFLSSSFLLPHLPSLIAFTLSTPAPCNAFSLSSSTITLTLDTDTFQQLGLPSSTPSHSSSPSRVHTVKLPIKPDKWRAGQKTYDRVQWCVSRLQPVHLLVAWQGDGDMAWADGMAVLRDATCAAEEWTADGAAVVDVARVLSVGCDREAARKAMSREDRATEVADNDALLLDLFDWLGLVTNRLTHLLPPPPGDAASPFLPSAEPTSPSAPSLMDIPLCAALPFLPQPSTLRSLRCTGVLSSSHAHAALERARSLLSEHVPWVALLGLSFPFVFPSELPAHGGDAEGNAEDDYCVVLCNDGRFLLYQAITEANPSH